PFAAMIQMRLAVLSSFAVPSSFASSPGSARSLTKATHFPSGLQVGESSLPMWVSGRRPVAADQIHRSWRKELFFQSGVSVAITAEEPSGESAVASMLVVLKYSSRVMGGLPAWAAAQQGRAASVRARHKAGERIRAI